MTATGPRADLPQVPGPRDGRADAATTELPAVAVRPRNDAPAEQQTAAVGPRTNLPSLTGLRWMAAFFVFGYHLHKVQYFAPGRTRDALELVFADGSVGVSFFFILSGFVLMWSSPRTPPGRFWWRRFARVYPLHLATAILAFGFLWVWKPQEVPTPLAALANLTLTHNWVQDPVFYQSLNTVSWTLACEAFFYFTFPLISGLIVRLRTGGALLLAGASLIITMVAPTLSLRLAAEADVLWFWHWTPFGRYPEFLLGIALARLVWLNHERLARYARPLGIAAVLVTVVGYLAIAEQVKVLHPPAFTAAGFALVLVAAAVCDLHGRRLIWARPVLVKLGELSFAFYLVHLLVIRALEMVFGYHPQLDIVRGSLLTMLSFGVALGVSWLLHAGVENPARKLLLRKR
ncbi:acyltransferase family protein [Catenuloplanes sp. NPDC051500]|uniref:acyltransferase family protein n=1 Tax=Catenuloplanes sp. NPDC051500 TaxID=3363959 RepID=UPI0037A28254